jgi:hypothetical protein
MMAHSASHGKLVYQALPQSIIAPVSAEKQ